MILHLYTSAKGGVGKTLQALCTSLYYLTKTGHNTLICDLNFFNADLLQIISQVSDRTTQRQMEGFSVLNINAAKTNARLAFPSELYRIPDSMPIGFFEQLGNLIRALEEKDDFHPDVCIVDTGFHFANFGMNLGTIDQIEKGRLRRLRNTLFNRFKPYYWFVWTLASLTRPAETNSIVNAAVTLESFKLTKKQPWFKDGLNLIHVINPHALVTEISLKKFFLQSFSKDDTTLQVIPGLLELSQKEQVGSVALKFILEDVRNSVMQVGSSPVSLDEAIRAEHIERFVRPINSGFSGRPANVFPIPFFDESLAGYTDSLALRKVESVADIMETVKNVYEVVEKYVSNIPVD